MECNWNIYAIYDRIAALSKVREKYNLLLQKSKKESEKNHFLDLVDAIDDDLDTLYLIIEDEYKTKKPEKKLLARYSESKEILNPIKFLWEDVKDIPVITKNHKEYDFDEKKHSLSKNDMIELTHDFFRFALDKKLYGNFMKNFYRRKDHVRFVPFDKKYDTPCGVTYSLPFLKESYITVNRLYTITDLITTIHEYMHATAASMNPNHFSLEKSYFLEIDSLLVEMLAFDYLKDYIPAYKIDLEKYYTYSDFLYYANYLGKMIKLVELENETHDVKSNRELRGNAQGIFTLDDDLEEGLKIVYGKNQYVISQMYAIELYKMYERDKDKSLHCLEKFILSDFMDTQKFHRYLVSLGVVPNEHLREYQKDINETASRLIKNKKEHH